MLGYLGVIAEQDGVDHLVRAVGELVRVKGFCDFRAVVVGAGPALEFGARARELARPCRFLRLHRVSQRRAPARPYQRL